MRSAIVTLAVGFLLGLSAATLGISGAPADESETEPVAAEVQPPNNPAPVCVPAPAAVRAGQTLVVGVPGVHRDDDARLEEVLAAGVGGVLITETNVYNAAQVRRLIAALREGSALPLLIAVDEEPGRVSTFARVLGRFSSPRAMAERLSPDEVEVFARQLGTELANLEVDLVFAPVVDVDDGPPGGVIGDRSFSGDPAVVAEYGSAFSRGLMAAGTMAGPKHFPGLGRAGGDGTRRLGAVSGDLETLREVDLVPFADQVALGVPVVKVGHAVVDALDSALPASLDPAAYALLRELGFEGLAVADRLGLAGVRAQWDVPEAAVLAVSAGADAVVVTDGKRAAEVRDELLLALEDGRIPDERLTEAAGRMAAVKGLDPATLTCVREVEAGRG